MSKYGSHKNMVDKKATNNLGDPLLVVCKDEFGLYVTESRRLDNGKADPNRFNKNRMERLTKPDSYWVKS